MPAPQRSLLPTVPGVPAYAAVLIAAACTFLGFLIDALGDVTDLTGTFSAFYILGCLAAVAAVRFRGLFTTMVLPPLLLFVAVPIAYRQLTGTSTASLKDILLNLAIPLVHRFPPMMLATALVLIIAGIRIAQFRSESAAQETATARRGTSWGRSERRPARGESKERAENRSRRETAKRPSRGRAAGSEGKPARANKPSRAETLAARSKAGGKTKAKSRPKRPERPEPDYAHESFDEPPRRGGRGRPPADPAGRGAAAPRAREMRQHPPARPAAAAPDEPVRANARRAEPARAPQTARVREPIPERRRPERR